MDPWLSSTIALVQQRDYKQLLREFTESVVKNLKVKHAFFLSLDADGRQLQLQKQTEVLQWSIFDFAVPFSHVLQDKKPKLMTHNELIYWQGNKAFDTLISEVGMDDACLVYPLSDELDKRLPLLVLIGHTDHLCLSNLQQEFLVFLEAFCTHCHLLLELKEMDVAKQELSEVISQERTVKQQDKKVLEISSRLIGDSPIMQELKKKIAQLADSTLSIMIQGETGTGKEVVASSIHQVSNHRTGHFIAINCSAIPENLLESELFGYEKGAFSGASASHVGLIKQADGGTLFLDEIGDMPMHLQCKLLRVLETKSFRPLGGKNEEHSNFRLISATHINLKEKVKSKEFRQDLYYRLMQCPLFVPKLSERKSDIEKLAEFFVDSFNNDNNRSVAYLNKPALDYLKTLDFHGNVRELKSMIELSCSQVEDDHPITLQYISNSSMALDLFSEEQASLDEVFSIHDVVDLKKDLETFESKIIKSRVEKYSGNKSKAARSLSIPVRTLTYKYQKIEGLI